jgi:hypothetical protein
MVIDYCIVVLINHSGKFIMHLASSKIHDYHKWCIIR